jgi:hypothetical protein
MLGFVSEYTPKTGALGLSIMGGVGMLSVSFILPFIGDIYETQTKLNLVSGVDTIELLKKAKLAGGATTLQYVAILPAMLIVVFALLYFRRKKLSPTD